MRSRSPSSLLLALALLAITWPSAGAPSTRTSAQTKKEPGRRPELVARLGHTDTVRAIATTPDGKLLASAGGDQDRRVLLWNVETGQQLRQLSGGAATTSSLAFTPDGKLLVAGGSDGSIRLLDVRTGADARVLFGHQGPVVSVAVSADGTTLASGSGDATVRLWDLTTGRSIEELRGHAAGVNAVAIAPDGSTIVSGSADRTVKIWERKNGRTVRTLEGHRDFVNAVAVSPDGSLLASGDEAHLVKLWRVSTGREVRTLSGPDAWISSLAFSADGKRIICGSFDGGVRAWNSTTGESVFAVREPQGVLCLANVGTTGAIAVSGIGRVVCIRDGGTGVVTATLSGDVDPLLAVATSPGGRWIATAGAAGSVFVWDVLSGRPWSTLTGGTGAVTSLAFSSDERTLVSGGADGAVRIWDVLSGSLVNTLTGHVNGTTTVSVTADGRTIVSGGFDKTVRVWDVQSGRCLNTLSGHTRKVNAVAVSPDGATLASGADDNIILLWDVASGRQIRSLRGHTLMVTALAFAPNGKVLASGGADNSVRLWSVESGIETRSLTGHADTVRSVAFSPDSAILVTAGEDRSVRIWDLESGGSIGAMEEQTAWATSIAFGRDGRWMVWAGSDGTVSLWDIRLRSVLGKMVSMRNENWLVVSPTGLFDGSPEAWERVVWRFSLELFDTAPVEAFFDEYFEPGLLAALLSGERPAAPVAIADRDRRQPRLSIAADRSADGKTILVRVSVIDAPAGARDVRLFRNGRLVRRWKGEATGAGAVLEASLPGVAGVNDLSCYCFNRENIKSADARLTIGAAGSRLEAGVTRLVVIGVNRYGDPRWNLRYAISDAELFAGEMTTRQRGLAEVSRVDVTRLEDADATRANILSALERLGQAEPEDTVIVYYAGHGTARDARYFLLPHDFSVSPEGELLDVISDTELEEAFERVNAAHVLFVLDSCNSGQVLDSDERRRGPMNTRGLAQLAYEKGMFVLAASQGYQAANEARDLGHGFLTYSLVKEGLMTDIADRLPKDGRLTVEELFDFASARVPELQMQQQRAGGARGLELGSSAARTAESEGRDVQRPRAFFRTRSEASRFVVARSVVR